MPTKIPLQSFKLEDIVHIYQIFCDTHNIQLCDYQIGMLRLDISEVLSKALSENSRYIELFPGDGRQFSIGFSRQYVTINAAGNPSNPIEKEADDMFTERLHQKYNLPTEVCASP